MKNRWDKAIFGPTLLLLALCAGWGPPAWGSTDENFATTPAIEDDLRSRYLETLRIFTSLGIESASDSIVELETAVARQHGADGLDQLLDLELEVAEELAHIEASLLLPLIALHERAHLEYRRQPLEANPYHARTTVYLLTQLYSEQVVTTGDRTIAADLFVSLAGYFQEESSGPGAAGLYSRALEYDPANVAALLGLATAREQTGRYRNALSLLERIVETGATDPETRLRLAINLGRLGDTGEAEKILEGLISEPADDWVSILAFQQLARFRMDLERLESAHDYLVRGQARFPDNFGLAVGLSYLEERLGLAPAQPLAAPVPPREAAAAPSARYRYARPGYGHIESTRERLQQLGLQNLPALDQALTRQAGPVR